MNYDKYMQDGMRQIVHAILTDVAKTGVKDEQSLYLTFQTDRNDVVIPDFVRAKYPKEMTIVLQHVFENLSVDTEKICVDLTFGGVLSPLKIPLKALTQFADPSANFGFVITPEKYEEEKGDTSDKKNAPVIDLSQWRKK